MTSDGTASGPPGRGSSTSGTLSVPTSVTTLPLERWPIRTRSAVRGPRAAETPVRCARPDTIGPMPITDPADAARAATDLPMLDAAIVDCFACPRLVAWREETARVKVARFRDETYWARPVPGYGDAAGADPHRRARAGRARRQPHRAGCSRATSPASSCGGRSTPRASATAPSAAAPATASRSTTCGSPRPSGAPRPPTSRRPTSSTPAARTSSASSSSSPSCG